MADIEQQVNSEVASSESQEHHVEQQQQELSIEDRARDIGWKPLEEYKGDPKKWRSAETYVELQPLYEDLGSLKKALKQTKEEQEREKANNRKFMQEYQQAALKAAEARFNDQLAMLKEEKKLALREGEADRVVDIDEQMAEIREQKKLNIPMPERIIPQEVPPAIMSFMERNQWYEKDETMQIWANGLSAKLRHSGMHPDDVLSTIEKKVKEEFPHKFRNTNRDKPSAVEGSSASPGKSVGIPSDMSEQERLIMKSFIDSVPGMTAEKYIKDWKKAGGR